MTTYECELISKIKYDKMLTFLKNLNFYVKEKNSQDVNDNTKQYKTICICINNFSIYGMTYYEFVEFQKIENKSLKKTIRYLCLDKFFIILSKMLDKPIIHICEEIIKEKK
jgi:hypothetical protein